MQAHSGDGYPWLCRQAIGSMCSAAFPPNCLIPLTWGMRYADHAVQRTQRRCTKKKAQPPPFISLSHLALITYHLSLYLTYPPMLKNKCGDATPPTPPHPPPLHVSAPLLPERCIIQRVVSQELLQALGLRHGGGSRNLLEHLVPIPGCPVRGE